MRRDLLAATALGSAAFAAAWTGQAVAQPAPNFGWAGPYMGGSLGLVLPGAPTFAFPDGTGGYDVEFSGGTPYFSGESVGSFLAWPTTAGVGGQIAATIDVGRNFQSGNLVYGWEGDASFLGLGSFDRSLDESGRTGEFSATGGVSTLFTFRPRVGVTLDRLLLYGTGGLGVGTATLATQAHITDTAKSANWAGEDSAWRAGFVVGAGAEYAVTPKMRLKFEALYYNLGSMNVTASGSGVDGGPVSVQPYGGTVQLQGTVARVGVDFGF